MRACGFGELWRGYKLRPNVNLSVTTLFANGGI